MRRTLYILILLLACMQMQAQETVKYDVLQLMYNGQAVSDSYLSPLIYDGWNAGLRNEWWTSFRKQPEQPYKWRHMGSLQATGGKLLQSHRHNSISQFDLQAGWGAHPYWTFHCRQLKGIDNSHFELYAGPYLGLDFMLKNISSNVNKPLSFDMGADLELMAGGIYTFSYKQTAFRLLYEGRINAIGAMWLPDYGESYYEITEMILDGSITFSHPGNRQLIHQQLAMDFQLKKSTWRLGVCHEYLHYGDRIRHFARQSVGISVGCIFNYHVSGTKL